MFCLFFVLTFKNTLDCNVILCVYKCHVLVLLILFTMNVNNKYKEVQLKIMNLLPVESVLYITLSEDAVGRLSDKNRR